jgi:tRNA-dihydrouridine synthase
VVSKGKGSGMLRDVQELDRFLDVIFTASPLPISVKTRLGLENPEDFRQILEVFNRYPITELTVHPRVRKDFYNGPVDMDSFRYALQESNAPVCYNGSLRTKSEVSAFAAEFPAVKSVMLGRGLIADPGLLIPRGTTADKLENFHGELLEVYTREFGGPRNAMFRLKENWRYWLCKFDGVEKLAKRLRKATDIAEYKAVTREILHNLPMRKDILPDWD